jgi:glycine cleavage system H protein
MIVPENLRYSQDHEWVAVDGDTIRIGITDYAQDALGDVVFVDLPDVGTEVTAGGSFGEVESTKSVSDLYAPMSGEVIEVNAELVESPQRLNDDPYGEGWICVVKVSDPTQLDSLLDAEAYQSLIED